MRITYIFLMLATLGVASNSVRSAYANDTFAEVSIGGLILKENMDISLDREDLYISREEVRVDYRFTNHSLKDLSLLVAFPLPEQNYAEEERPSYDLPKVLNFQTTVDNQPIKFDVRVTAKANGRDVTQLLASLGLDPYSPQDFERFDTKLKALLPQQLSEGVASGLFKEVKTKEETYYQPLWSTQTVITRTQIFPAGRTIVVSHRYKPLVGGSVGGGLNPDYRELEHQRRHLLDYCIDDVWLNTFDQHLNEKKGINGSAPYKEYWLGYVLSSGANWKGPIKEFRLVVDKGSPDNLVSFCAEDVKTISPTQYELRKTDFEPNGDLRILLLEWNSDIN